MEASRKRAGIYFKRCYVIVYWIKNVTYEIGKDFYDQRKSSLYNLLSFHRKGIEPSCGPKASEATPAPKASLAPYCRLARKKPLESSRPAGTGIPRTDNLTWLAPPSDLSNQAPRLPLSRWSVCECLRPTLHPHKPLLPHLPRLQPEEPLKRIPRRLPRTADRRQHLARRRLAGRTALGVAGVVLGRGVGLVELQSLSARTVDAGAGAG